MSQYAAAVRLGQLLNHSDDSSRHLAPCHIYLLHQCSLLLRPLLVFLTGLCCGIIVEAGVNRRRRVILDPLSFRQDLNSDDIGVQGTILMLERLYEELLLETRHVYCGFIEGQS